MNVQNMMLKQQLAPQQLLALEAQMHCYRKEPVAAFLLAFFLGIFGIHHFYLGRMRPGIIMLVCTLSVVGLIVSIPWKIVNWFTVWRECADVNDEIEYWFLYQMVHGAPAPDPSRPPIGGLPMTAS